MASLKKMELLRQIQNEKSFREDFLKVLLNKMGYKGVVVTHGPNEQGKDIVFHEVDTKTDSVHYFSVVAKVGKLKGGTNVDDNNITTVYSQILSSFNVPYEDPVSKKRVSIHRVWVATNDVITNAAKTQIINLFGDDKGVVQRNVEFFPSDRLIDLIDKYWPDYFIDQEPYLLDYCKDIEKTCKELNEIRSLGFGVNKNLSDIFIEPTLIEKKKRSLSGSKKRPKASSIPYTIYEQNDLIEKSYDVWIIGQPGSGKSTILRYLALKLSEDLKNDKKFDKIPVFICLKDLFKDGKILKLSKIILEIFDAENLFGYDINTSGWLKDGRLVVFLDGLDEIPDVPKREQAIDEVIRFKKSHLSTKVVGTCRELGFDYLRPKLKNFRTIEILPFNFKQMKTFVEKWFTKKDSPSKKMIEAVKSSMLSKKLPSTPLALTLLAVVFEESSYRELPANITELYSMFTEVYLGRWDLTRNIDTMFNYHIKESILKSLAYHMHQLKIDSIDEKELIKFVTKYSDSRKAGIPVKQIIMEIEERSNILVKIGNRFQFLHFSFQEYFASQQWIMERAIETEIAEKVLDYWWSNVVFFYMGTLKDSPKLIDSVINYPAPKDYSQELHKYLSIGNLLQAAYLTNHNKKIEALKYVFENYFCLTENIYKEYQDTKDIKLSEFMCFSIMEHLFVNHYASITLKEAMIEMFKKKWKPEGKIDRKVFFDCMLLSVTLASLEEAEYIEGLAGYSQPIDAMFLLMIDIELSFLMDEYDTKIDRTAIVKLKKRIKKASSAIRSILQ